MKNHYMMEKVRLARIGTVFAVLMAAVVILAPNALGANHPVSSTGLTFIDQNTCYATITTDIPFSLDVDDGDSVTIYYNYTYIDHRPGRDLPNAEHVFSQIVAYGGGVAESHGYNTTKYTEGNGGIQHIVYNVMENTSIWVELYANITSSQPQCIDSDWVGGNITLT